VASGVASGTSVASTGGVTSRTGGGVKLTSLALIAQLDLRRVLGDLAGDDLDSSWG
jgi:hypothetical protein